MAALEEQIHQLVRQAMMEEINNLGIRATLRQQIVDAGFTKDDIRSMVQDAIDSFCRSALNTSDVEGYVRAAIEKRTNDAADKQINKLINQYSSFSGNKAIEDALLSSIRRAIQDGFDVSVSIKPKANSK
jgi:hypothetical protein